MKGYRVEVYESAYEADQAWIHKDDDECLERSETACAKCNFLDCDERLGEYKGRIRL